MNRISDLGCFIRTARLQQDRTQRNLALRAATSQAYIDKLEHNQIDARLSTIVRILGALGYELTALTAEELGIVNDLARPGAADTMLVPEDP